MPHCPNKCLEIGPRLGQRKRLAWDTLDIVPGCTYRVEWGADRIPVRDQSYDFVLASHVLEHVPWFHTSAALSEVVRVLKHGGHFEVWVPDFWVIAVAYLEGRLPSKANLLSSEPDDPWRTLNQKLFWGARRGEEGQPQHFHKACFDKASLARLLDRAGFASVTPLDIPKGRQRRWGECGLMCIK